MLKFMTWDTCHALLDMTLDALEERHPFQPAFADLADAILACTEYPTKRWTPSGALFSRELHHQLDMTLRNDGEQRRAYVAWIGLALHCKHDHQDAFTAMAEDLREATRELADDYHGLDPDTADPLATLYDALVQFQPRLVKTELRELLREDKYQFQRVDTRGNRTLIMIREYLDHPMFDVWAPTGPAAKSGATAQGHPERDTWYRDGNAHAYPVRTQMSDLTAKVT